MHKQVIISKKNAAAYLKKRGFAATLADIKQLSSLPEGSRQFTSESGYAVIQLLPSGGHEIRICYHINDHLEKAVAVSLERAGIEFVYESEDPMQTLDFYLPQQNVYIEVKQYHADRVGRQLASQDNIILLQGKKSVEFFK